MNIYVGNLPHATTEDQLRDAFAEFGEVASARIITDKFTGKSRGFGFVEIADDAQARAAIEAMNESELGGRTLTVNEARPKADRGDRPDRGGRGGGGGRGFGGGGGGRGGRPGGGGGHSRGNGGNRPPRDRY